MSTIQLQKKIKQEVPKFRFPEFSGAWEEKKLGDFLIYEARKVDKPKDFYKAIGIRSHFKGTFQKLNSDPDKIAMDKLFVVEENDFIVNITFAWEGALAIAKKEDSGGFVSHRFPTYTFNKSVTTPDYFRHVFPTKRMKYLLELISPGGAGRNRVLDKKDFLKIKINLPSLLEQQRIANFLESVNGIIDNLSAQKEFLGEYKRGVMQKIFSQEIRFKDDDGKIFPKWEEKKLEEILKERKEYSTKGKGYPHISLTTQGVVPKSERYNRDFLVGDDEVKGYKITRLNDLCYNPANLKFGVISINKLGAGIFSPIYVTFEIIGQNIDFVGYYLIRDEFINKARRYEQGTVYERMAVSPADFVKVKVAFPSLPEQQKIADFLNSLDKAIEAKQQQITLAENWKKGLMQGLFI